MYSRRDLGKLAGIFAAAAPLTRLHAAKINSTIHGVLIEAQTYSFRDLPLAKRLAPLAEKHRVRVALHGRDQTSKTDEFSTRETFAAGLALSPMFFINLDIGHFTAANDDPVDYLQKMHDKILVLHLKDRKKNHGDNVPWGQGETPIKPVLQLLRTKKWKIPCNIEYEYGAPGMDTVAEVRKCFEYCKQALA